MKRLTFFSGKTKTLLAALFMLLCMGLLTGCGSVGEMLGMSTPTEAPTEAPTKAPHMEIKAEPLSTPEPTATPTPEPTPEVVEFVISAAGDVTLGNHHLQDYGNSFRQMYDNQPPEYFLQNVREYFENDNMTIVNLEGTLTLSEEPMPGRTYNIKGDPEYIKILTTSSVEAVSLGNNHRYDYGEQGANDTEQALREEGIEYAYDNIVGIYESPEGIRVGYVSSNEASMGPGVEKYFNRGIEKLKEEGVDLIFACCHWGIERENYPTDYQKELGRKLIDQGVDLVIGHHPHVIQGLEEYKGKYIIYSLGNFCFGANRNPVDKDCFIFRQTFRFEDGVKLDETQAQVIPCSVSSVTYRNDYCPTPLTGDEGQRVIDRLNTYSTDFNVHIDEDGLIGADR